ncbi:hypothetical protein A2954_03445 [Candidatus Roizmanbacteria bacterium RIFCSPLOWO2_01_FULL_37_12]|uniref:Uncharacterized protein n=1 Tax=Candidatus Roizmanbacteria bacterium RIFCSPLOWO2_01_FULL_37_12 TaxID=1802056 RepID=A0A1F7IF94_9BACT|nr:MAG: hypothetical protein A2954_03445 [Candidatus Roizmanbacteria bacterium RIFCSPLOWO2_01_FULL_37_12]
MLFTQEAWFLLFFVDFFLLGFVAVYAYYTYYKHMVDLKKVKLDSLENAKKIMDDAGSRSKEVIEKVDQKAVEILAHSQLIKSDLDKGLKDSLRQMTEKYIEMIAEHSKKFTLDYENILTSVKNQSLVRSKQALDNIEQEVKKQLEDSKAGLKEEMLKSLNKATVEISQYKVKEIAKIDQEIDQLVVEMAKDLLRINLSPKDHRKLVVQSLEKAKEQGLFFL